ncbi:MAG: ABC transporter ATP-binding protein [Clostridiales bacterium]|nr:ABC transporter ATP-binding protein [Clostridiales bacterium]
MIKKLAKSIREYKVASILSPLFVSLEVVLECLIPWIISKLVASIDVSVVEEINIYDIIKYGGILIGMAILSLACGALSGMFCAKASTGFAKNLRKDMYYKIQNFSFENIDKFSTASLVTRMTTDVNNVQFSYMMIIRIAVRGPLMIVFSLVMAFVMGGSLGWIFVAVIPPLTLFLLLLAKKAMPLFKRVFKKYDNLNESIQENIRGMRVVKSFNREEYEKKKFDKAATDVQIDFTKAERILAMNNPIMQFFFYGVLCATLWIGSYVILKYAGATVNVGEVSQLIVYGMQVLMSLMMVSMVFVMIIMSAESARRVVEVLDEKSTLASPENAITEVKDGSIEFKGVKFKYSAAAERFVLDDINLSIKSGETIGIIGGTGSSKTSLVNLISRLYDVTEGSVSVGGRDVREYDLTALRNQVAVVLQKNELFSGSIKENLRWGNPNATDEEMETVCKLAQADEFIRSFPDGYDTHIEQGGTNVSGGQKQRLCIARALLKNPKILILDDSTSAVDTRTDKLIRDGLKSYAPETTKIIIAQRTSSVEDADRIIVIDGGKIDAVGSHKELLGSNAIYTEVYTTQNKGGNGDGNETKNP